MQEEEKRLEKEHNWWNYIEYYFKNNIVTFEYYFFSQTILLLTIDGKVWVFGVFVAAIFFIAGFSQSVFPVKKGDKIKNFSTIYLLTVLCIQLVIASFIASIVIFR